MSTGYSPEELTRAEVDASPAATVLDFGTNECGYCQGAEALIASAVAEHTAIRHVKIEDGKGRPLGRSFAVKLWPTLIFLAHGRELARIVRPTDGTAIRRALAALAATT